MKQLTHLKNVYKLKGFTIGKEYKMYENSANSVTVLNDFGAWVTFEKIEGEKDFKNFFQMT
jgi:hypothetical protein